MKEYKILRGATTYELETMMNGLIKDSLDEVGTLWEADGSLVFAVSNQGTMIFVQRMVRTVQEPK